MGYKMIDASLLNPLNKNAIVIRHSDRDHMQPNQIYQPLNEVGRQNACILGEKLRGFKKYAFFSSPVDRCIETNECIIKGIFQDDTRRQISISNVLGEPGPYVVVRKQNAFKQFGCHTVVAKQIAHEPLEGIRPTEEGAKMLVDYVLEEMNKAENETLLIFVTHDAIVGPTIFELTGEKFNKEHWPEFIDGFAIENSGTEFKVVRSGKYFDLRKF